MDKKIIPIILALTLAFLITPNTQAQSTQEFYGSLLEAGINEAPLGTEIIAKINDEIVGSTYTMDRGVYGLHGNGKINFEVSGSDGDLVYFYVKKPSMDDFGQVWENAVFASGEKTNINMTFDILCGDNICDIDREDCFVCEIDCGICEEVIECTTQWKCTEWTACDNGAQSRSCQDQNSCGFELDKPAETRICAEATTPLTGMFLGFSIINLFLGAVIIIIVLVILMYWKAR
jgi:hypothetical protein